MDIIQISLNEFERLKGSGIEVNDINNQKYLIIGEIAFLVVVGNEDIDTIALKDYEDQQNDKEI
jgi:hypothetical protein